MREDNYKNLVGENNCEILLKTLREDKVEKSQIQFFTFGRGQMTLRHLDMANSALLSITRTDTFEHMTDNLTGHMTNTRRNQDKDRIADISPKIDKDDIDNSPYQITQHHTHGPMTNLHKKGHMAHDR